MSAVGWEAVQHGSVRLVHAIAKDDLAIDDCWRTYRWQLDQRCALGPGRLDRFRVRREHREAIDDAAIEGTEGREQNVGPRRHRRGSVVLGRLERPEHLRLRGAGDIVGVPGPPIVATVGGPGGLVGERWQD